MLQEMNIRLSGAICACGVTHTIWTMRADLLAGIILNLKCGSCGVSHDVPYASLRATIELVQPDQVMQDTPNGFDVRIDDPVEIDEQGILQLEAFNVRLQGGKPN